MKPTRCVAAWLGAVTMLHGCGSVAIGTSGPVHELRQRTVASGDGVIGNQQTRVGNCIKQRLKHVGADASKLTFFTDGMNEVYKEGLGATVGQVPPLSVGQVADSTVVALGFTVDADRRADFKKPGAFYLRLSLIGFTPLSDSASTRADLDVILLDGERSENFYVGRVTANGTLYRSTNDGRWTSLDTETVRVPFFMEKKGGNLNVALNIGVSAGRGYERVTVASVSDATEVAIRSAGEAVISRSFGFDCYKAL